MRTSRAGVVDSDLALLNRTARRLGLQASGLVAVVVIAVAVVVGLLVVHQQRNSDEVLLRHAAAVADDATDPPAGMWLTLVDHGEYAATPGLPASLPYLPDLRAVEAGHGPVERRLTVDGVHVEILTQGRSGGAVQAVLNLRSQDELATHVAQALALVGVAGLLLAAAIGSFLARRAVAPLATALARQREFVADASHELRTPLTLLSTRAQLLQRRLADGGEPHSAAVDAQGVVDDTRRLADIVDDLLLAADTRPDRDRAVTDLGALCAHVLDSATPLAHARGVTLQLDPQPVAAVVNATAVRRAVLALVDNAIHHTPSGGQVTVEVGVTQRFAQITISDTGPGLDPAQAEQWFRRFASGSQRRSRRGYGLGLALVRDVAARHGGEIRVLEAPDGIGARFRLQLPTGLSRPRWRGRRAVARATNGADASRGTG